MKPEQIGGQIIAQYDKIEPGVGGGLWRQGLRDCLLVLARL